MPSGMGTRVPLRLPFQIPLSFPIRRFLRGMEYAIDPISADEAGTLWPRGRVFR